MSHRKKTEKDMYYEIEILKAKMEQMEKRFDFMQTSVQSLMQQQTLQRIASPETDSDDSASATTTEPSLEEEPTVANSRTQMQRRAPV